MFSNHLKVAWRQLIRNKSFSIINIMGLALGLSCSLLILLWVQDEKKVDAFHRNSEQLFKVYERNFHDGKVDAGYPTQGLLAEELRKNIPEIIFASGLEYAAAPGTMNVFESGEKINKMGGCFAGEDFFKMFSFPLLEGSADLALKDPLDIAISRKMAEYFFGSPSAAIGKTIRFDNKEDLKVSAVFENLPKYASRKFDFLRSWTAFVSQNAWVNNWGNTSPDTYVQLRADADPLVVEAKIKDFIYKYQQKDPAYRTELALQPFAETYLRSNFENGVISGGRIQYINLFSMVAFFIILIACINFMNLATARSAKRAKEVGLRKTIGASRLSLIKQFMGEALFLCFFSIVIAFFLASLILPLFNQITGKTLEIPYTEPVFWLSITALLMITGLLAGSYPALFLSSLKPVKVLKGTLKFKNGSQFLRQGLVVFQFSLSLLLIMGTIVIFRQTDYIQSTHLGYDRENLLYVPIEGELVKNYPQFKNQLSGLPSVASVSKMRNSPTVIEHHTGSIEWPGKDPDLRLSFADAVVGYDFAKTLNLTVKAGRDFSKDFGADSMSFLINETAARNIGYDDPIGKPLIWGNRRGTIIGVLKDFHFSSLHQQIEPLVVRLDEKWSWGTVLIRLKAGQTREALSSIEKISKELNPKFPFTYQFSDYQYSQLYRSEETASMLSNIFAFLAILISCLGLFGLATFTAAQRAKEIGVRKVLGASVGGIVTMLSNNFLRLVVISMLIAFPVSWLLLNEWLKNFAYRVPIDWWMFAIAGFVTIAVALLTVSYQSIKAAITNPVKSLRSE